MAKFLFLLATCCVICIATKQSPNASTSNTPNNTGTQNVSTNSPSASSTLTTTPKATIQSSPASSTFSIAPKATIQSSPASSTSSITPTATIQSSPASSTSSIAPTATIQSSPASSTSSIAPTATIQSSPASSTSSIAPTATIQSSPASSTSITAQVSITVTPASNTPRITQKSATHTSATSISSTTISPTTSLSSITQSSTKHTSISSNTASTTRNPTTVSSATKTSRATQEVTTSTPVGSQRSTVRPSSYPAKEAVVILEMNLKINENFTDEMTNASSEEYMNTSKLLRNQLQKVYGDIPGFRAIVIIALRQGSIACDYNVFCSVKPENRATFVTVLKNETNKLIQQYVKHVENESLVSMDDSIQKAEKLMNAQMCKPGYILQGAECTHRCNGVDCGEHGHCDTNSDGNPFCRCSADGDVVYSGPDCATQSQRLKLPLDAVIGIPAGLGGGLLVILLIVMVIKRHRKDKPKGKEIPGASQDVMLEELGGGPPLSTNLPSGNINQSPQETDPRDMPQNHGAKQKTPYHVDPRERVFVPPLLHAHSQSREMSDRRSRDEERRFHGDHDFRSGQSQGTAYPWQPERGDPRQRPGQDFQFSSDLYAQIPDNADTGHPNERHRDGEYSRYARVPWTESSPASGPQQEERGRGVRADMYRHQGEPTEDYGMDPAYYNAMQPQFKAESSSMEMGALGWKPVNHSGAEFTESCNANEPPRVFRPISSNVGMLSTSDEFKIKRPKLRDLA